MISQSTNDSEEYLLQLACRYLEKKIKIKNRFSRGLSEILNGSKDLYVPPSLSLFLLGYILPPRAFASSVWKQSKPVVSAFSLCVCTELDTTKKNMALENRTWRIVREFCGVKSVGGEEKGVGVGMYINAIYKCELLRAWPNNKKKKKKAL